MNANDKTNDRERRRKRRAIAKFGLAGVALLGIGAAMTSAAWTDDAWFTGNAEAATVELQGSLQTGSGFIDADTSGGAVAIPTTAFKDINQGANKSVTLYLKNTGSVPVTLSGGASDPTLSGAIFAGADPADVTVSAPASATLAAGAETSFTVTLTTDANWPDTYQGTAGTITLHFTGTSS
ncbi:hypothetical protein [Rarobacter incanus]|uniref:Ribosomally synthesized peptide with SipW-like signal peptide n=1 Tax=Rarobacter incanus TaxID=153494 RepID=A0A542SQQ3_9MICO|nr:hypothetical protein [Rarobacter incanus]TQK76527.1 hypothetical protein FB389_1206 [Rarobacter incanus]